MLLAAPSAHADKRDLERPPSTTSRKLKPTISPVIIIWLDGYGNDKNASPVIDFDKVTGNRKTLGDFCGGNPDVGLITGTD